MTIITRKKVCVLGGTGFVGSHLVANLNTTGLYIKILTRRRERHRELLVLPNAELVETNIHDPKNLQAEFKDMDVVINLVGILNEKSSSYNNFRDVHVELPRKILNACIHNRVTRILHMSALNANAANSPSFYLRTKGEGENHLHTFGAANLNVTSFKPSVIFGPNDSFFNRFAKLLKLSPYLVPLACANTKFAPLYVSDLVTYMIKSIDDKSTYNKRIDLCGPTHYTLQELMEYTCQCLNLSRKIIAIPDFMAKIQAVIFEYFVPGKILTIDNYRSLKIDSICDKANKTFTDIKTIVPQYLMNKTSRHQLSEHRKHANRE